MTLRMWQETRLRWHAIALLVVAVAFAGTNAHAAVCRVEAGVLAGGDGLSWATPKDLAGALADTGCDELWLKQGVYKPVTTTTTPTTAERAVTFQISRDLLLYGGFAGNEMTRDLRDPVAHPTILSGDIQGDDTDPDANGIIESSDDIVGGNSYHVMTMGGQDGSSVTAATLLDGITITAGQALGSSAAPIGGGLLCWAFATDAVCSPRLNDVDFRGNSSGQSGGGMFSYADGTDSDSSPSLTRVRFSGNFSLGGGGLANVTSGSNNSPNHLNRSSPSLVDVSFIDNSGGHGAGMLSQALGDYATVSPTLSRVTFSGNNLPQGSSGGAMYVRAGGLHVIVDPVLSEVTFSNNSAFNAGGAMFLELSNGANGDLELHPVLRHVTFANNSADVGGAIASDSTSGNNLSITFSHVIFWGNSATNVDNDINLEWVHNVFFEYTILAEGCVPNDDGHHIITCGDGNLTADPLLGPLQDNGGFTLTQVPGPGSPAIDAGDPANCSGVDQRGVARPQGPRCDIGAVEVIQSDEIFTNGFEN